MNKEIITNIQGCSLITLYLMGSVLGQGAEARQDVWLAIILALFLAVPLILIYARILFLFPGMDLFDILHELFGKMLGSVIAGLFIWYSFHLGSIVIRSFTEFIQIVSLQETPQYVVVAILGAVCIWYVRAGIEVMARWSTFVSFIILSVIISLALLSLNEADFTNLKPVLEKGIQPVLSSAFTILSFPLGETVVFTMVFSSAGRKFHVFKVFMIGVLIGTSIMLLAAVRNILVLGTGTASLLYFPSYSAISLISLGEFLQRIEIIVSVVFLLAGLAKIGICLYAASNGLAKIFGAGNKLPIIAPVCFLMMDLSCVIYKDTIELFEWSTKIYRYYSLPFQIMMPLFFWLYAEIHKRRRRMKF